MHGSILNEHQRTKILVDTHIQYLKQFMLWILLPLLSKKVPFRIKHIHLCNFIIPHKLFLVFPIRNGNIHELHLVYMTEPLRCYLLLNVTVKITVSH